MGSLLGHSTAANIAGGAVDGLVNAATLPAQLGATVGRGIVNEGMAIGQGIANGDGVVGSALNTAGHWVGNEASAIGSGIASGAKAVGSGLSNTASAVGAGLSNTASAVGTGLSNGASWVGNLASSVGSGITSAAHSVVGGAESFGPVIKAARSQPEVSVGQTFASTQDFIRDQPFFHEGVMNAPIGDGKHFRNVPFVGPAQVAGGVLTGNSTAIQKGVQVTRGTWDAP